MKSDNVAELNARVAELEALLPPTFYADRSTQDRYTLLLAEWQRTLMVNKELEARTADFDLLAEDADTLNKLRASLKSPRQEERERCAKLADAHEKEWRDAAGHHSGAGLYERAKANKERADGAHSIAAAIRQRTDEE